jgi:putative membrane protein
VPPHGAPRKRASGAAARTPEIVRVCSTEITMYRRRHDRNRSPWKGAVAGLVGGAVASWAMSRFQAGLSKVSGDGQSSQADDSEDATMKAAAAVSETVADRGLTKDEKRAGGSAIHYAFGSSVGAAYGALAEVAPRTAAAWGLPFGAAVWLGADEVAVPAFGLAKSPLCYPASTHASALASHLVYGLTADAVRRMVRAAL